MKYMYKFYIICLISRSKIIDYLSSLMKNSEKKGSNSGDQKIRCPEGENDHQNWILWIE